jgi:hypothetical protein
VCVLLLTLGLVLTAAEEKAAKKTEAKSLLKSPRKEPQKEAKSQETESKPEKRGALEEEASLGLLKQDVEEGGGQAGLRTEVTHHRPIVTEKVVHVHVPVPVPYPVEYVKHVPYPVNVPVPVVVHKPFPVPVPKPFHVTVEKKEPYPVVKHVPYHVKVPVEVPVKVPVEVPVPKPYTVPDPKLVPLPVPQPVIDQIPLFIKQHSGNQETYRERQYEESAAGSHNINIPESNYEIPVQSHDVKNYNVPETYKAIVPETGYRNLPLPQTTYEHVIPDAHQYIPEYQQQTKPEAYYYGAQAAGISSHELGISGGHKGDSYAGLAGSGYLIHGHQPESHGYSYQRVNTC